MNPNILTPLALVLFPLFMIAVLSTYPPGKGMLVALLAAELLLPPNYALPITPSFLSKWIIPGFTAGVLAPFYMRSQLRVTRPFRGVEAVFLLGFISNTMTYWTNRDVMHIGPLVLPPNGIKDLLSDLIRSIGDPWVVFYIGRALFKTSRDLRMLSRVLVIAMLLYSLPMLFEMRMSPCLNRWIYGYQASGFGMTVRWGGYRPTVFFKDGLPLAAFVLTSVLTALAMVRARLRVPYLSGKLLAICSVILLVTCKSTGVIIYAMLAVPLICFSTSKRAMWVASGITIFFLAYPFIRASDIIPLKAIVDFFGGVSTDRAGSLNYRFEMEQGMLDHTLLRPWWGWGSWGRNMVYDAVTGEQVSVPDGAVILTLSTHGYAGFFTYFFPFAWTVIRARKLTKKVKSRQDRILLAALSLNCAIILFDLIINSAFFPYYMLLFGALYSLPSGIAQEEAETAAQVIYEPPEPDVLGAYARTVQAFCRRRLAPVIGPLIKPLIGRA